MASRSCLKLMAAAGFFSAAQAGTDNGPVRPGCIPINSHKTKVRAVIDSRNFIVQKFAFMRVIDFIPDNSRLFQKQTPSPGRLTSEL